MRRSGGCWICGIRCCFLRIGVGRGGCGRNCGGCAGCGYARVSASVGGGVGFVGSRWSRLLRGVKRVCGWARERHPGACQYVCWIVLRCWSSSWGSGRGTARLETRFVDVNIGWTYRPRRYVWEREHHLRQKWSPSFEPSVVVPGVLRRVLVILGVAPRSSLSRLEGKNSRAHWPMTTATEQAT